MASLIGASVVATRFIPMKKAISRRSCLKSLGSLAAATILLSVSFPNILKAQSGDWPILGGPDTPKLCPGISRDTDPALVRMVKHLGVDHVLFGGPKIPWKEQEFREIMDRPEANGLKVIFIPASVVVDVARSSKLTELHDVWTKAKFAAGKYKASELYPIPNDMTLKKVFEESRDAELAKLGMEPPLSKDGE